MGETKYCLWQLLEVLITEEEAKGRLKNSAASTHHSMLKG